MSGLRRDTADDCVLCPLVDAEDRLLLRSGGWLVARPPGLEVPGWVVVLPIRHVEALRSLTKAEAAALGPLLVRVEQAIHDVLAPTRVYLASFGENHPHWHALVVPRTPEIGPDERGPALLAAARQRVDAPRSSEVVVDLRELLARSPLGEPTPDSA